jgi:phosphoadenosine phosphosulfate reductase
MSPRLEELKTIKNPMELLRAAGRIYGREMKLACSFSPEDIVLIDMLREAAPQTGVFALDTGRLHEETYEVAEAVRKRFGIEIEWYFPDRQAVENLERAKGLHSFRESLENRHECCGIRKVEPLKRAVAKLRVWITGRRQDQSITRYKLEMAETDPDNINLFKINPLAEWSASDVWGVVRKKQLPYNILHERGFSSIGCAPCTRPIAFWDNERSGRWWWENPESRECGLHVGQGEK